MKKIRLHPDLMNQIADEENVSLQTVRMSLYYVFNSKKSQAIRSRAKQLLLDEAEKVQIEIED